MRVSQGFWGTREHWKNIEGNKGTLANFWEQGEQNSKNYSTKTFRESVGTWEHRAILEGNKGTRIPPGRLLGISNFTNSQVFVMLSPPSDTSNSSVATFSINNNFNILIKMKY